MAEAERCDMGTWLIEMAYIEFSDILRGHRPSSVASADIEEKAA